jgi:PAS domain S-box-containing protein
MKQHQPRKNIMKSESLIPDKDLEDKCKHLERLVEHHTAELTASNEKLQKENVRRKKAEAALREGEEKYRNLFENAVVGIVIATVPGGVIVMNKAFGDITGYSFEAFSKMNLAAIYVNPEDRKRFLERVKRHGRVENFEVQLLHKSGKRYWASYSSRPIIYDGQEALLTTVLNITKRKRAEKTIGRFARIFRESLNEIFLFDAGSLKFVQVNRAAQRNLGYTQRELKNLTPVEIKPEISHEDFEKLINPLRKGETEKIVFETVHQRKDQSLYDVEVHLQFFKQEREPLFVAIILDITKRRRAEKKIEGLSRLKEELLGSDSLMEKMKHITDGVVEIMGADFARIWLTQQGDRCDSGCRHAQVTEGIHVCRFRDKCLHLVASSGRYTHIDGGHQRVPFGCYKIGRVAAAEEPGFLTNDVTRDPRVHNHDWAREQGLKSFAGYRLISHEGTPIGVLALFSQRELSQNEESLLQTIANTAAEVIQVSRSVEEMARLNTALEAKNTELEQVVYVASHDLRSPLVNIDGYSRELAYDVEELSRTLAASENEPIRAVASLLEKDIPESLHFIQTSASKMDTLLSGLLRLSRSGRAALTIAPLDMNSLISNVVDSSEFQIREARVQMAVEPLPPCHSDGVQLNQVFSNLLSNALKYMDPDRPGVIRINGRTEGKDAIYCVEDDGIGISVDYLDKIFEIFHRLDPDRCEGDGLGLTIVKRIVGRLEGTIRVESEEGSGTRFYVTLPTGLM